MKFFNKKIIIVFIIIIISLILSLNIIKNNFLGKHIEERINQDLNTLKLNLQAYEKEFMKKIDLISISSKKIVNNILNTKKFKKDYDFINENKSLRLIQKNSESETIGLFVSDKNKDFTDALKFLQRKDLLFGYFKGIKINFLDIYFISKNQWIVIIPSKWANIIEPGHDFTKDIFYSLGTPEKNPLKDTIITDIYYDDIWNYWMCSIIIPVYKNSEFLGIIGHDIIIDNIYSDFKNQLKDFSFFVVNNKFEIIYHEDLKNKIKKRKGYTLNQKLNFGEYIKDELTKIILTNIKNNKDGGKIKFNGNIYYYRLISQKKLGWKFIVIVNRDKRYKGILKVSKTVVLTVSLFIFFIFSIIYYLFYKFIIKPINEATKNLKNRETTLIKHGEFKHIEEFNELFSLISNVFKELKRSSDSIAQSKRYLETLMRTAQTFIVVFDEKFNVVYVNDFGLKKLNLKKENLRNLSLNHFIDINDVEEIDKRLKESDKILDYQTNFKINKLTKMYISISISKLFNIKNTLIGYIAVILDITKQQKAEINLKNQLAFSEKIFKSIPEMLIVVDPNLKIIFANQKAKNALNNQELIGSYLSLYLTKESIKKGFDEILSNMIKTKKPFSNINTSNPFNSKIKFIDIMLEPFGIGERVYGALIIMRDVSEWRDITEEINELQMFMTKIIDTSPFVIISINDKREITLFNNTALKFFNINHHTKVLRTNIYELVPVLSKFKNFIDEAFILNKSTRITTTNIKISEKDDKELFINISIYPIKSKTSQVIISIEDVTELIKLQSKMLQSQKLESLGLLTTGIIHDFNNILTGIIGYASLLEKTFKTDDTYYKYIKTILDSSEKAAKMTRQILDFSKKRLTKEEKIELNKTIEDIITLLSVNLSRINIIKNLSRDKIHVLIEKTKLSQILINLIVNAKDAVKNKKDAKIEIKTETTKINKDKELIDGTYCILTVSDNGYGIKKDNLSKIFDPFFTTKKKDKGTGLGLATVKSIITDYNGKIEVKSIEKKGTTFKIYLPMLENVFIETTTKKEEKISNKKVEGKVLLIDDEEVIREIGKDMLESINIDCITAENGKKGIEIFKENKDQIAFVILDVEMPEMSGDIVFDKLKEIKKDVKILIASGYSKTYIEENFFKREIANFIAKPFKLKELSEFVNRFV